MLLNSSPVNQLTMNLKCLLCHFFLLWGLINVINPHYFFGNNRLIMISGSY